MNQRELEQTGSQMADELFEQGNYDLKEWLKAKNQLAIESGFIKRMGELLIDELQRCPNGKEQIDGYELSLAEAGVKYDFSAFDSHAELVNRIKSIDKEKKELEKELKAHSKPWVDPETGEEHHPVPKTSKTVIKVNFIKK